MTRPLGRSRGNDSVIRKRDMCDPDWLRDLLQGEGVPQLGEKGCREREGEWAGQSLERGKEGAGGSSGRLGLLLPLPDYFGHRWIMTDSKEVRAHLERKEADLQGCPPSPFPFWGRVLWAKISNYRGWGGAMQLSLEM